MHVKKKSQWKHQGVFSKFYSVFIVWNENVIKWIHKKNVDGKIVVRGNILQKQI